MDEKELIERLGKQGGKVWEKGNMRRVYFNASAWGLDVERYNTGNISGATINGERISNSEAGRCLMVKVWYDLGDGKVHVQGADALHATAREALDAFISGLAKGE